jgi:hypothetical protein
MLVFEKLKGLEIGVKLFEIVKCSFHPNLETMEPFALLTANGPIIESLTQPGAFTVNGSAVITSNGVRITNALIQSSSVSFNNLLTAHTYTASFEIARSNPGGIGWADGFTFAVSPS